MVYTSGIYKNGDESLKVAQEYKLDYVANAIELKKGDKVLDIGCGWGRLIQHFRDNYDAEVTGITLSSGQKAWAEKNVGVNKGPGTGVIMLQDGMKMYDDHHTNFDIVPEGGFDKITSLEMAEHVGIRRYNEFLTKVHELLKDDGVFYFQVAGLRRHWRYEDLIWYVALVCLVRVERNRRGCTGTRTLTQLPPPSLALSLAGACSWASTSSPARTRAAASVGSRLSSSVPVSRSSASPTSALTTARPLISGSTTGAPRRRRRSSLRARRRTVAGRSSLHGPCALRARAHQRCSCSP